MPQASPDVVILSLAGQSAAAQRAEKIVRFVGATVMSLLVDASAEPEAVCVMIPRCTFLVIDAETLVALGCAERGENSVVRLFAPAQHAFVYGFRGTEPHHRLVQALSAEQLPSIRPGVGGGKFQVTDKFRPWCGPLSGLTVGTVNPLNDTCFAATGGHRRSTVMIEAGKSPFLVRIDHGRTIVFLAGSNELADLDELTRGDVGLLPWFSRVAPLVMVLRGVLGDRTWHADRPRACFIVDDPLLRPRYGFMEYAKLLDSMRRRRFATSIAFIPWNYNRSRPEVADLVRRNGDKLSLCVHGCDHTFAEFATRDIETLSDRGCLALERMRAHEALTSVPFDEVMVFPQGLFSSEAPRALKRCGYLAAANSVVCPTDVPEGLPLRDMLDVAVTRFADFPLFSRRYPRELGDFAFDLFLGKPALIVEHHDYFDGGYDELEDFVDGLGALDDGLEWRGLGDVCGRANLKRVDADGVVHVRFYTPRFLVENTTGQRGEYVLHRRQQGDSRPPLVTAGNRPWQWSQVGDDIRISISLESGEAADITISENGESHAPGRPNGALYRGRVLVRRLLCEWRDNHVATNRILRRFT
jgi:hypothetical protein